ncbi:hypothetical protein [Streptomyces sp. NPDC056061]|uniref:hypothetical protein n=1 Tax=Streptomyces sp. NPDC056061 TaxID=3345700 RepID=UPI0035DB1807
MSNVFVPPHIQSLSVMKERAESVAAEVKHLADALRVEYTRQLLQNTFPRHTRAVFTRDFDEDEPTLTRLLSADDEVATLDLSNQGEDYHTLTNELKTVVNEAEQQITRIGSDIDIFEHLDPGEVERDDGIDFILDLTAGATA